MSNQSPLCDQADMARIALSRISSTLADCRGGFESFATRSSCVTAFLSGCGIGSRLPVQNDRNSRNKLVQTVEVADIPGHYAGTDTPRLKIDERIVEVFPLMTRTLRRAAQTKELARKHSRFAPR